MLPINWTYEVLADTNVAEHDIHRIQNLLGLTDFNDERRDFLSDLSTVDVSACPGSGKTTLVIAKMLLLYEKWKSKTRGMLLLSHTNVAKNEIAERFSASNEASSIAGRPHFVGTIHSFMNKYLAEPYLRSLGYPPMTIDDDITGSVRRRLLGANLSNLEYFLTKNHTSTDDLRITEADLSLPFGPKLINIAKPTSKSYINAAGAVRESVELGYIRYDEIFTFAKAYLDKHPEVAVALRRRFPLIIIDEMQDTRPEQVDLFRRLFPQTSPNYSVQRIGDPNQTIYGKAPDDFPARGFHSISDSYRFGQGIARLADPLAVNDVLPSGLKGLNKKAEDVGAKNTFIVFPADKALKVLPTFAEMCLQELPDELLTHGKVTALGARHSLPPGETEKTGHHPKIIGDYFPQFQKYMNRTQTPESTFVAQISQARAVVRSSHQISFGVENIAGALLRHCNKQLSPKHQIAIKTRKLGQAIDLAAVESTHAKNFKYLVAEVLDLSRTPQEETIQRLVENAQLIVSAILGRTTTDRYYFRYQKLTEIDSARGMTTTPQKQPNTYTYSTPDGRQLNVDVGTIYKAKGETHTATLLLDTFQRYRLIKRLLRWMYGEPPTHYPPTDSERLRLGYVAMTRPSHFLAVAGSEESLGTSESEIMNSIDKLSSHGWRIHRIDDDALSQYDT